MRKIKLKSILLGSILLLLLCGCQKKTPVEIPVLAEPVSVSADTVCVEKRTITELSTFDGQIIPTTIEITSEKTGILGEILVQEGERVNKGDVVARLSDGAVMMQLSSLREQKELTEKQNQLSNEILECDLELLRLSCQDMEEQGAEETTLELIKLEVERAETELRHQKERQELVAKRMKKQEEDLLTQLGECDILAPSSGEIIYVTAVQEGSMVTDGNVLAVLASEEDLMVRTEFVTDWMLKDYDSCDILWKGELSEVLPRSYDRNEYVAAILRKGSFYSYYTMIDCPDGIKSGDYVQLQVAHHTRENVCVIPVDCLYRDANGSYVYKSDGAGNRIKTPVALGTQNEIMVEITDGLSEGEVVYVKN